MIGMTRAHMADPHIVRKIIEGREHDIRPCVGATYCLDRIYQGGEAYCIHNPATGRELKMPHVIATAVARKKVVVVGAGPAGWKLHGFQPNAATTLPCLKRPINRAGKCGSQRAPSDARK